MFRQLFEYLHRLFLLARETEENRSDIEALQRRVEDLTAQVILLASEVERVHEREKHEREKFMLKVENELLRFERRLPSAKRPKK